MNHLDNQLGHLDNYSEPHSFQLKEKSSMVYKKWFFATLPNPTLDFPLLGKAATLAALLF